MCHMTQIKLAIDIVPLWYLLTARYTQYNNTCDGAIMKSGWSVFPATSTLTWFSLSAPSGVDR